MIDPVDGLPWDIDNPAKREKCQKKVMAEKPMPLIGSPMCTAFSQLQELSRAKRDPAEFESMLRYTRKHLDFCVELYKVQI